MIFRDSDFRDFEWYPNYIQPKMIEQITGEAISISLTTDLWTAEIERVLLELHVHMLIQILFLRKSLLPSSMSTIPIMQKI